MTTETARVQFEKPPPQTTINATSNSSSSSSTRSGILRVAEGKRKCYLSGEAMTLAKIIREGDET